MPWTIFQRVLENCKKKIKNGSIAVLASWIREVAAVELEVLKHYDAVTIIDGDSLWQAPAIPEVMAYGHASATLEINARSLENRDKLKRLEKLTFEYCQVPRDFLKIATPWRWPRGSPAQQSFVHRIKPLVFPSGEWRGGDDYEVVMNAAWDTYNNWGLRKAFNNPKVYTPVPWFARSKPLEPGSVFIKIRVWGGVGNNNKNSK